MIKNVRSKYYSLVLYPNEDATHKSCIDYISSHFDYALIKHNCDLKDNSLELKKEHYHVVIAFKNYRYLNSLIEELNISSNYIETSNSLESALKYLIHFDNKEKYQYSIDDVSGTLKEKLRFYVDKAQRTGESSETLLILETIDSMGYIYLKEFMTFICENDLYSTYRRNYIAFKDIITEHNKLVSKDY